MPEKKKKSAAGSFAPPIATSHLKLIVLPLPKSSPQRTP
jgi:hypothetical protein